VGERYLITGGAGFIGSHLADDLVADGHRVHVLDDLSTGSMDNIRHLRGSPLFEYTIDSAMNRSLVAELVDDADVVYHLAAAVGVELIVESPVRTIETNVHSTEVVLEQANKKRKPVLIASTSEVYGKSERIPFREDHDLLLGPTSIGRWAYAVSKMLDESLAIAYWKERKQPSVVVRLFNTVGPRQTGRYGMVLPTFVRQALANRAITVYGDGTQRRCFCDVDDVVDALVGLMRREEAYGQVYNVGSTEEVTIGGLAEMVRDLTGSDSEIALIPYEEKFNGDFQDMARRMPDTTRIADLLGWAATRSLSEIVASVIDYQRASDPVVPATAVVHG
jgi:UDP-glucose 4-epimerase